MENRFASLTLHPRARLLQTAPLPPALILSEEVLDFHRRIYGRIEEIFHDLGRIKAFSSFTINSYTKIRQRRLIDDVKIFSEFLTNFLEK